jgi:predicted negative regulator of RcsB-dependent stress response
MMKMLLLALAGTTTLSTGAALLAPADGTPAGTAQEQPAPAAPPPPTAFHPLRPGFAARLAQRPPITGPDTWAVISEQAAWRALATGFDRQAMRWDYARSLIGRNRGAEAMGVLDVMQQDDPDLRMVDSFRLAKGAALTLMHRYDDARAELGERGDGAPLFTAEACAWQMRALAEAGHATDALARAACAWPALQARTARARKPFLIAAARATVEAARPGETLRLLTALPDRDPTANLYRGRAYAALGRTDQARLRFARTLESGSAAERADARLAEIEAGVADGTIALRSARNQLAQLRYGWRGDQIEERSLLLSYRLAARSGDDASALNAGATLLRYFDPQRQPPGFQGDVQAKLATLLAPGNRLPLDRAAGLFWDYRDLLPGGPAGDALVTGFSARLQRAGLYQRAALLLEYQLFARTRDLAQGPLSARVASLFVLAGRPDHALTVLRRTDNAGFTPNMLAERRRVEAVALSQTGQMQKALALLEEVPDGTALRAELLWKQRNWDALATTMTSLLPGTRGRAAPTGISDVEQAIILRQAIALAMLGRGDQLALLHDRYAAAFAPLPSAGVFNMLTGPIERVDPALIGRAMAAIPSVSPAGTLADLIDAPAAGT